MKNSLQTAEYILGLDIGTNSIGWAIVNAENGKQVGIGKLGVRIFPEGVEGDIVSGTDKSRASKRREMRLRRRQLERTRRRLVKLLHLLQSVALMPQGEINSSEERNKYFFELDNELFSTEARQSNPHVLPYLLRARALQGKLAPYELGRALYHLAQRRGFASNKKQMRKKGAEEKQRKKDVGIVKTNISELQQKMAGKTLGEYFSKLDLALDRIRNQYTDRKDYEKEFDKILIAQEIYYSSIFTNDFKKRLKRAIFYQRPIKKQKNLIGKCELEQRCQRAQWASLDAQRFRLLQKVNDLRVKLSAREERNLNEEERAKLIEALEKEGDLSWGKIRKLLNLKGFKFNFETNDEEELKGDRISSELYKVFGDRWMEFLPEEKDQIIDDIRGFQNLDALKRRGMNKWGLTEHNAQLLVEIDLEEGYCNLSLRALAKVLHKMEKGVPYATACKEIYPDKAKKPQDLLPRLETIVDVRNPAVHRALTELRKVTNDIIRNYGKPEFIRVELLRDLKKPRKEREKLAIKMGQNKKARKAAIKDLEDNGFRATDSNILKWLLMKECNEECPYTGRKITPPALFGDSPQFDVEHIIPRYMGNHDNSFMNKTLCYIDENRGIKQKQIPYETYKGTDKWEAILHRVSRFTSMPQSQSQDGRKGKSKRKKGGWTKLDQFMVGSPEGEELKTLDDFTTQQLNDSAYASRLAIEYLACLYGAGADGIDTNGKRRLQAGRGQITGALRNGWRLNEILGGGKKVREDHRQHAIDAVVISLTDAKTVKMQSEVESKALTAQKRASVELPEPWKTFLDDVREAVGKINVSHRAMRKVAGALHKEHYYSKPFENDHGKGCVHIRKQLKEIKDDKDIKNIIDNIVDPRIRCIVKDKYIEMKREDKKKSFSDRNNHPHLVTRKGTKIPIHSVRVRVDGTRKEIGAGATRRWVEFSSNHHIEIFKVKDKKGKPRWEGDVVTTMEAMKRQKAINDYNQAKKKAEKNNESFNLLPPGPVIQRDHSEGTIFQFSLCQGEIIEIIDEGSGVRSLKVIEKITKRERKSGPQLTVGFVSIYDARKSGERDLKEKTPEQLRKLECRKIIITPLGEIRTAND